MTPPPLSPAAQAVLVAHAKARCQREWSTVNDPPCHPSDPEWNGCGICVDRAGSAAAIRALVEQKVPIDSRNRGQCNIRAELLAILRLAIADELDGGNTPTETP